MHDHRMSANHLHQRAKKNGQACGFRDTNSSASSATSNSIVTAAGGSEANLVSSSEYRCTPQQAFTLKLLVTSHTPVGGHLAAGQAHGEVWEGLVKILKKYDNRTGVLIPLPFIQNVLLRPFFNTDLLYQLVEECEAMLDQLLPY
ncbi:hypothetical protein QYE76_058392 [Lolium multiflorum]|uniref:Uncharacterized protein n=1 Tax=Lolium multiflorum TaxID=4521 RepID=A0AAD8T722_LOLMU|nr:hypothetical protein QYE76_058392 [Lolium multiflorum]